MSVLVEAISVIVRRSSVESRYPGGNAQYERDCPNRTFCADEHLTRVGFMAPLDVKSFVEQLGKLGFVHVRDGKAIDIAVVDQMHGPTAECDWLEAGKHPDGYAAAWLAGTLPGGFCHPEGWQVGQSSKLTFSPNTEVDERFIRLAREDNVDTLLDLETGRERFIGRVKPTDGGDSR
jgi:hypothetical protein